MNLKIIALFQCITNCIIEGYFLDNSKAMGFDSQSFPYENMIFTAAGLCRRIIHFKKFFHVLLFRNHTAIKLSVFKAHCRKLKPIIVPFRFHIPFRNCPYGFLSTVPPSQALPGAAYCRPLVPWQYPVLLRAVWDRQENRSP